MQVFKNPRCSPLASKKFQSIIFQFEKRQLKVIHSLLQDTYQCAEPQCSRISEGGNGTKRYEQEKQRGVGWEGFVPFFKLKTQRLFKDFQKHISLFPRTPFSAKKSLECMSFLVLPQHEQFYPEGLSVFAPLGT